MGDKPSINGGLKYLKYCIKIVKTTINFLLPSRQKEYICKKWLPFEAVLGVWNFSVMLQIVCFNKLNVFCLCKIVYACHMFLYLYLPLLFFKNKQITKKIALYWAPRFIYSRLCTQQYTESLTENSNLAPHLLRSVLMRDDVCREVKLIVKSSIGVWKDVPRILER